MLSEWIYQFGTDYLALDETTCQLRRESIWVCLVGDKKKNLEARNLMEYNFYIFNTYLVANLESERIMAITFYDISSLLWFYWLDIAIMAASSCF